LWITNVVTYVFITSFTLLIDAPIGRRVWRQALLFPGMINVLIIVSAVAPHPMWLLAERALDLLHVSITPGDVRGLELFVYVWLAGCMAVVYLAKITETRWLGRFVSPVLLYIGGYGPLLCTIFLAAVGKEQSGAEATWDKTEKTGQVAMPV